MRAQKIQHKAAKIGFDWDNVSGAVDKLYEEIDELKNSNGSKAKKLILKKNSEMFSFLV